MENKDNEYKRKIWFLDIIKKHNNVSDVMNYLRLHPKINIHITNILMLTAEEVNRLLLEKLMLESICDFKTIGNVVSDCYLILIKYTRLKGVCL